jgi:cyclase
MNHDGTKIGFAYEALKKLNDVLDIPVIASGGAGKIEHFEKVFKIAKVDAALAASVFHFQEISIPFLKEKLANVNLNMRIIK